MTMYLMCLIERPAELCLFNCSRLNSTEYGELREKLHAPIRNAANVVIHQSLSDLFLETFKSHVEMNTRYSLPRGQVGLSKERRRRLCLQ